MSLPTLPGASNPGLGIVPPAHAPAKHHKRVVSPTTTKTKREGEESLPLPPPPRPAQQQQQQHVSFVPTNSPGTPPLPPPPPARGGDLQPQPPPPRRPPPPPPQQQSQQPQPQAALDTSVEDTSSPPHAATTRTAIRRRGSFNRLSSLSEQLEQWVFMDQSVHSAWAAFARTELPRDLFGGGNAQKSASDTMDALQSASLQARAKHEEFCAIFEEQLEAALEERGVSLEQFTERLRLDKEEEEREGTHFYRWLEVIEFPSFMWLASPPAKLVEEHSGDYGAAGVANLLAGIRKLSDDARRAFRKSAILGPIVTAWAPQGMTFAVFEKVMRATLSRAGLFNNDKHNTDSKSVTVGAAAAAASASSASSSSGLDIISAASLGLNRADAKQMVRWKQRLKTPVLNERGVYGPPALREDEIVQYLGSMTVAMRDDVFDRFSLALRHSIREETDGDIGALEELRAKGVDSADPAAVQRLEDLLCNTEQRLLLEFFFELDVRHQGKIPLASALNMMLQAKAVTAHNVQRALARYRHCSAKQPGEIFLEQQEQLKRTESKKSLSRNNSVILNAAAGAGSSRRSSTSTGGPHHHHHHHHEAINMDDLADHVAEEGEDDEEENEVEDDPNDPPVSFQHFVQVVREPLRATLRGRTLQKKLFLPNQTTGTPASVSSVFEHHDAFVERVNAVRAKWRDKA